MTAPTLSFLSPIVRPKRRKRPANRTLFLIGVVWIGLLVLAAVFADFIPGLPHYSEKIGTFAQGPDFSTLGGILGTDGVGRSNLARIIYGARISLTIAVCSTLIGLLIGLVVGLLAGYYRGFAEGVSTIIANTLAALPPLIMLLALVAAIGASLWGITLALGVVIADTYIRVTKGAVISNAQREYVLAAKALGATDFRIIVREILPNLVPVLAAVVPISMAVLVVVEGSLSFLGYGIPAPNPSWGGMIAAGADTIRRFPGVIAAPVVTLFLTVFAFNVVGDYLGNRADKRAAQI
jgi:peptide/nickel transport system permease protein